VPYGINDVLNNRGTVYVGNSADTPAFAVDAIAGWWKDQGRAAFPTAKQCGCATPSLRRTSALGVRRIGLPFSAGGAVTTETAHT
jgi:hypothetical protein